MNAPFAGRSEDRAVWSSRRLWSLWEIMIELGAANVVRACSSLTSVARLGEGGRFSTSMYELLLSVLNDARVELEKLEAPAALATIMRIFDAVNKATVNDQGQYSFGREDWIILRDNAEQFASRVYDEFNGRHFFSLTPHEAQMWSQIQPSFGTDVQAQYPTAAFEIDEASKCLALNRGTACVFHLMRTLEIAVRAIARCLSIPDPTQPAERNWGVVLRKIRDGINAKWPTVASRTAGDGEIFDALYASLDAVKNPWRNQTMHPALKYTGEEAEHVLAAVRGFMIRLASRCDENGDPRA
jgi:hypothetical protein